MTYGVDWVCECGWANLDVRKHCRKCGVPRSLSEVPALEALAGRQVAVPDGWTLVPCEPTDMMVEAGRQEGRQWLSPAENTDAVYSAMLTATPPAPQAAEEHPDDAAVDRFAAAMKAKMKWEREHRGRSGWDDPKVCPPEYLARLLVEHLTKGNPGTFEDVANFCMMLHQQGCHPAVLAEALATPPASGKVEAEAVERWADAAFAMEVRPDGQWVRYSDHEATVAAKQAEIERLRKAMTLAHALMRECGWQLAPAAEPQGDGVLELACAEVEETFRALLKGETE